MLSVLLLGEVVITYSPFSPCDTSLARFASLELLCVSFSWGSLLVRNTGGGRFLPCFGGTWGSSEATEVCWLSAEDVFGVRGGSMCEEAEEFCTVLLGGNGLCLLN